MRGLRALFLAAFVLLAQQQPVAFVRGRVIMAADVAPDARTIQQYATNYSPAQFKQWLVHARQERLSGLIWAAVKEEFCRNRECEPMRKVLEEQHKRNLFGIYDPQLHKQLWAYYTSARHNGLPDGGKFLETPWWLQSKPVKRQGT